MDISVEVDEKLYRIAAVTDFFAVSVRLVQAFPTIGSKGHLQKSQGVVLPEIRGFLFRIHEGSSPPL
jgi:hypothetical protein